MSDIGEARLLPSLITALRKVVTGIKLQTLPLPHTEIATNLDAGKIDFAFGYLPNIGRTQSTPLFHDKYSVVVHSDHPFAERSHQLKGKSAIDALMQLEYVAVRSHAATWRILRELGLEDRLVLSSAHFLSLPEIVMATDLGVIMPRAIAKRFAHVDRYTTLDVQLPKASLPCPCTGASASRRIPYTSGCANSSPRFSLTNDFTRRANIRTFFREPICHYSNVDAINLLFQLPHLYC